MKSRKKISSYLSIVLLLLTYFLFSNCDTTEPPPPNGNNNVEYQTNLSSLYAGLNEIILKIEMLDTLKERNFQLERNDSLIMSAYLFNKDTVVTDTALIPSTSYTYKIYRLINDIKVDSMMLTVNMLDTTSHNVSWQEFIIGEPGSIIFDICAIDENDVWAVGEIESRDTTGNLHNPPFNIAHWDGTEWEYSTVLFNFYYGSFYADARGIFSLGVHDIIVSSGGCVMHWDGNMWENVGFLFNLDTVIGDAQKMWGNSLSDFFVVGLSGSVAHWNGTEWRKIESGTEEDFQDIYGAKDPITGENIVICVTSISSILTSPRIFQIKNNSLRELSNQGLSNKQLAEVWFKPNSEYYAVGSGIFRYTGDLIEGNGWWENLNSGTQITPNFSSAIHGVNINDIWIAGSFADVVHFNGSTWYRYTDLSNSGIMGGITVAGDNVFICGTATNGGKIFIGSR